VEGPQIKPDSPIGQILAESRDTKFRLEMLEKLVSDKLGVRGTSLRSALVEEPNLTSEKPVPAKMVSSGATDALNQTVQQSHGRAWHGQPNLWNNADAEFLKYHVSDAGGKSPDQTIGMAEKFTPTVDDIESALFKEGADPAEFARVFMARGDIPFERTDPNFGPRFLPIAIGMMMLMVVAYLIF
jgi:hypothetical protein